MSSKGSTLSRCTNTKNIWHLTEKIYRKRQGISLFCADHGSLAGASRTLNISQPSISTAIAQFRPTRLVETFAAYCRGYLADGGWWLIR